MYVKLTKPDGEQLVVNPNWVSAIEHDEDRGQTKIRIGSSYYYWVKEPIDMVIARCEDNANCGPVSR